MANLVRVEPSLFRDNEKWFVYDDGRSYLRCTDMASDTARSDFPSPSIRRDSIAPARGMDGRMHDSLASLRRTYRSDGNPQGETYHEIGNAEAKAAPPPKIDRRKMRDDIKAGIEDVRNGRVQPPVRLEN